MSTVDPATAASARSYPSISLLVGVDDPGSWRARLSTLRDQAVARLVSEFGPEVDRALLERLDAAVEQAEAPSGARGLAVFVSGRTATVRSLDTDVRDRVVVDDTFATRDLVAGDLRSPKCWILALSLDDPRLVFGSGRHLRPVALTLNDTHDHPSSRRDRRGRDRSDVTDAKRTRRFRAIDQALNDPLHTNSYPLLVVGAEPTLSRFLRTTRHIRRVEGTVRRAPDRSLDALAAATKPALDELLAERRVEGLAALDRAVSKGTAASGIEPVWRAARRARGLLLVEDSYEQPARVALGGGLIVTDDPTPPDVIDDAVDDVIETVLARGGQVEFVHDGALTIHDRIAFAPWTDR